MHVGGDVVLRFLVEFAFEAEVAAGGGGVGLEGLQVEDHAACRTAGDAQFAFGEAALDGVLMSEAGLIDKNIDAAGLEIDVAGGEMRPLAVDRVSASERRCHGHEQKKAPGNIPDLHGTYLECRR